MGHAARRGGWVDLRRHAVAAATCGVALLCSPAARPADLFVSTAGVDAPGCGSAGSPCRSIRAGCDAAVDGDVIRIGAGTYFENVELEKSVTLGGEGAGLTVIDGGGIASVIYVARFFGATVTISDVAIQGGLAEDGEGGGGVSVAVGGDATLLRCVVRGNAANTFGLGGGGIFSTGTLVVRDSTITGNRALQGSGGGVHANLSETTLINCTITGNQADDVGGGVFNSAMTTRLVHCTVTQNAAGQGGGVFNMPDAMPPLLSLDHSIVSANTAFVGPDCAGGSITSEGYDLVEDLADCVLVGDMTGLVSGIDPLLGPLGDNGGPTPTFGLLPGSPARDAGDPTACADDPTTPLPDPLTTDQRGFTRPSDGDADGTPRCDIGAVEEQGGCGTDTDGDTVGDACDACPAEPGDRCTSVDLLRNADVTRRWLDQHESILRAGGDPVLDPVRDLHVVDVDALTEVRVAGDGLPVGDGAPGVLVFYEVRNVADTLFARRDGADVVLRGW